MSLVLSFHSRGKQTCVCNRRCFSPSLGFLFCFQEIEVGGSRKAIIIFVPVPQLKSFQKIQVRLVRELEKKFSGKHVVFIAQVRMAIDAAGLRGNWGGGAVLTLLRAEDAQIHRKRH